jgi:hypothetical protein
MSKDESAVVEEAGGKRMQDWIDASEAALFADSDPAPFWDAG